MNEHDRLRAEWDEFERGYSAQVHSSLTKALYEMQPGVYLHRYDGFKSTVKAIFIANERLKTLVVNGSKSYWLGLSDYQHYIDRTWHDSALTILGAIERNEFCYQEVID